MNTVLRHLLPVTRREYGTYTVPYWTVDSGRDGPSVLITAALHGNELQAVEGIRRAWPAIERNLTAGRCCLVPMANPCAVFARQPHMEFDITRLYRGGERRVNANSGWPGDPEGRDAERLAAALKKAVVDEATHLLDLHAWNAHMAATALSRKGLAESMRLGQEIGVPFARRVELFPDVKERPILPCTLTSLFHDTGRVGLCVEFSGQYAIRESQARLAERAVLRYLQALDMLPDAPAAERSTLWVDQCDEHVVAAPLRGLFVPTEGLAPGDDIDAGVALGHVFDPETLDTHPLEAPAAGRLLVHGPIPRVSEHTMMFYHAYVEAGQEVARILSPRPG